MVKVVFSRTLIPQGLSGFRVSDASILGRPSCRLPMADVPQAFRIPATALVLAPGLEPRGLRTFILLFLFFLLFGLGVDRQ
jgi:hypothetical protein